VGVDVNAGFGSGAELGGEVVGERAHESERDMRCNVATFSFAAPP
jgi:hypothetical protein